MGKLAKVETKNNSNSNHLGVIKKGKSTHAKLTKMYRGAEKSKEMPLADSAIDITKEITKAAKTDQEFLVAAHKEFPQQLQDAVTGFAKSIFISSVAEASGVSPFYLAMATVIYGIGSANADSIKKAVETGWVWTDKFHESNPMGNICTAKNFADICGRSHLSLEDGTNILPAVTREINAYTTSESFTWGGWFTMRDCFTKTKVEAAISKVLELVGLDKALSPGNLCSFSSSKFQGTQATSTVIGLSSEACTTLTSNLNFMSQKCSDGIRAGAIDFGLALGGIAACAVFMGVTACCLISNSNTSTPNRRYEMTQY